MSEWQPLETAPKDGSTFIVWSPAGPSWGASVDLCEWSAKWDDFIKHGCGFDYATHWMPLPEPPEQK